MTIIIIIIVIIITSFVLPSALEAPFREGLCALQHSMLPLCAAASHCAPGILEPIVPSSRRVKTLRANA